MQLTVPDNYGYVILTTCVWSLFFVPTFCAGDVMKARKECNVQYPNLYATPGYHKQADEFNRVQRGHQNMFETLPGFTVMNLLGGLKHPIACSIFACLYGAGNILYLKGYSDKSLDVKDARYKKGGAIKFIGYFGSLGSTISLCAQLFGWW